MHLSTFNGLDDDAARDLVRVWAAIPTWTDALVAGRPYASVTALASAAEKESAAWDADSLASALAHHPRIGQKPAGAGAEARASRLEQAAMSTASITTAERMAAGNAAYEERFGRIFLIRAAGRSAPEMLAELERRLGNSAEAETSEAIAQLREIALLRLHASLTEETAP
ncbi:2-oxo-4-hydroxy-4-carboxy-5-ureidoimidazoline decarboxylase [Microbacterium sp.]|uniref:2-oxo-4-hydroxy-4-carboxy-5-ureidoimidazoline decarboxylase n=1 Tax=Microbacterium sp. TaxID=51671 RepID=UPI003221EA25